MSDMTTIAGREIQPGTKYSGVLNTGFYFPNAPRDYIRRVVEVPYTVICGREKGPTLCVTAGMDPTEYAAIAAAIKLSTEIGQEELHGNLIVVHVSNILGFWERKYVSSIDYKQLTSVFPGSPTGTTSEVMAYHLFQECISKAEYYLDLHGSDGPESMLGHSAYYITGDKDVDDQSQAMAKALGYKFVEPHEIDVTKEPRRGSTYKVSAMSGIPSALSELGEADYLYETEMNGQYEAVRNVMRYLKMIDEPVIKTENQKMVDNTMVEVTKSGLFFAKAKLGEYLEKEDIIGYVKDLFGNTIEVVKAPARGAIVTMLHNPVVEAGEVVVLTYALF